MPNPLKPCPCCGGKADFDEQPRGDGTSYVRVKCAACGVATPWRLRMKHSMNLMPLLGQTWNKRVGDRA